MHSALTFSMQVVRINKFILIPKQNTVLDSNQIDKDGSPFVFVACQPDVALV